MSFAIKEKYIYTYSFKKVMALRLEEQKQVLTRKLNVFEIGLFFTGCAVILVGFYAIHKQYVLDGYLSWNLLQGIFLWLILLVLLILAAILENIKEEGMIVIKEHILETKLLRQETSMLKECIKRKR